jgi:hypothetical protein
MLNSIVKLLKRKKTVFSVSDLAILWNIKNKNSLKSKIYYLVKNGSIIRLYHGIFALDNKYNKNELAGKLKSPSYVSLKTTLRDEGCIFQYSDEISSVSNNNKEYVIDNVKYTYRKMKDSVLFNTKGVDCHYNYSVATKERAFLDMIYFNKDYYFDNLEGINWEKCEEIVKIYNNKTLIKRLNNYKKHVG